MTANLTSVTQGIPTEVMARSTADLMAAQFGMAGYGDLELGEIFSLLRGLRVTAGDFRPQPVTPAGEQTPAAGAAG